MTEPTSAVIDEAMLADGQPVCAGTRVVRLWHGTSGPDEDPATSGGEPQDPVPRYRFWEFTVRSVLRTTYGSLFPWIELEETAVDVHSPADCYSSMQAAVAAALAMAEAEADRLRGRLATLVLPGGSP